MVVCSDAHLYGWVLSYPMVNFRNLSNYDGKVFFLFAESESAHENGFLRSGSFLAESSLFVTSSKSRNPKGFTTEREEWSKNSCENIRISRFCYSIFAQNVL